MALEVLLSRATAKLGRLRDRVWGRTASKERIRMAMLCRMLSLGMMILGIMVDMMTGGEMPIACSAIRIFDFVNEIDTSNLHLMHRSSKFSSTAPQPKSLGTNAKHPTEYHSQPRSSRSRRPFPVRERIEPRVLQSGHRGFERNTISNLAHPTSGAPNPSHSNVDWPLSPSTQQLGISQHRVALRRSRKRVHCRCHRHRLAEASLHEKVGIR